MLKYFAVPLLVAACAGGAARNTATLDEATPIRTSPIDPALPSADRIANQVEAELGPVATTEIELCAHPDGKVSSVLLVGGSALPAFDVAVVEDAARWRFDAIPGPDTLERCDLATIVYDAYHGASRP